MEVVGVAAFDMGLVGLVVELSVGGGGLYDFIASSVGRALGLECLLPVSVPRLLTPLVKLICESE